MRPPAPTLKHDVREEEVVEYISSLGALLVPGQNSRLVTQLVRERINDVTLGGLEDNLAPLPPRTAPTPELLERERNSQRSGAWWGLAGRRDALNLCALMRHRDMVRFVLIVPLSVSPALSCHSGASEQHRAQPHRFARVP